MVKQPMVLVSHSSELSVWGAPLDGLCRHLFISLYKTLLCFPLHENLYCCCYNHIKLPSPSKMHWHIWPPAESGFPRLP